ncbi:MAG: hypothetical protein FJ388_25390, partial [Verrucomicrobia bacterium]|nr:hypothetical protein [Verrucomicrobiota bacterium]
MIEHETLSAYVEGLLDPAERARVAASLASDEEALGQLADQRDVDCLLRSVLHDECAREVVKQSILTAVAAPSLQRLRQRVLADTSARGERVRRPRLWASVS